MKTVDDSLKQITKGTGIIFIGLAISKILGYVYRLITARLGVEQYGMLSLALGIFGIAVMIGGLGLPSGALRFVAFYLGKKKTAAARGVIVFSLKLALLFSLLTSAALIFFSKYIAVSIFHTPELTNIIRLIAIGVPFYLIGANIRDILRGFQQLKYEVYSENIAENLVKIIVTVGLIFLGYGIFGAIAAFVIALVVSMIMMAYFLDRKVFPVLHRNLDIEYAPSLAKKILRFSLPLSFGSLLTLCISWLDTFMIGYFLDTANVGLYNAAVPTTQLLNIFPFAMVAMFFPRLTELFSKKKIVEMASVYKVLTKWIFLLNLIIASLLLLFPKEILRILFGEVYVGAAFSLVVLAVAYFVSYYTFTSTYLLMVLEKTKYLLYNSVLVLLCNLVLNYYLIPKFGLIGAALATAISFSLMFILVLFEVSHAAGFLPFTKKYIPIILCVVISFFGVHWLYALIGITTLLAIIVFSLLFIFSFIILLIAMRAFEREDIFILEMIERKLKISPLFSRLIKRFA